MFKLDDKEAVLLYSILADGCRFSFGKMYNQLGQYLTSNNISLEDAKHSVIFTVSCDNKLSLKSDNNVIKKLEL